LGHAALALSYLRLSGSSDPEPSGKDKWTIDVARALSNAALLQPTVALVIRHLSSQPFVQVAARGLGPAFLVGALVGNGVAKRGAIVRSMANDHAVHPWIEGILNPHYPVILIEDLFSRGNSSIEAVRLLKQSGFVVSKIVALFRYGDRVPNQRFIQLGVPVETIFYVHRRNRRV